jgi:hypothetical protein
MNWTINEIRAALKKWLIIIGIYILVSLFAGACLVTMDLPFAGGFVLTAISGGALYWLLTQD